MKLTRHAVRNYRFVIVFTIAAMVLGVLGYIEMPRKEDPTLPAFGGIVTVIYPTATAEEIENRILEPIEEVIHDLEEIQSIESIASDGVATITGEFRDDVDKNEAYDLFLQRVSSVLSELPDDVLEVSIEEMKPSSVVVLQVAIHGATPGDAELRDWAEELEDRWRLLDAVKDVEIEGQQEPEVHVEVDPAKLAAAGLSLTQVHAALASSNAEIPAGSVQSGARRLSIRPHPRFETLEDIETTVLGRVGGRPILLRDLASVSWGNEGRRYRVRHDGQPAVLVTAGLKDGRSVFDLTPDARTVLEQFREDLPEHLQATLVLDQSEDVKARLNTFGMSLLQGGAIIALFVALMVGWRAAVVAISAMFLAIGISFWLMEMLGISLQQMSIAGLVVVLGLLVDNAVVVFESILHERHKGADAIEAAIRGTDRVSRAVVSATATTVAAFVPMMFMAGSVGDFTRDIPTVVSLVLVVSLGVALFVTPLIATRLFRSPASARAHALQPYIERIAQEGFYAKTLDFVGRRPRTAIIGLLVLALGFIGLGPTLGMNFFPRADDKPTFLVRIKAPQGTNLDTTDAYSAVVESWLMEQDDAKSVTANIGNGNPMIYYNTIRDFPQQHFAELLVTVQREDSQRIPEFARKIRENFAEDPRFVIETKLLVQGPPIGMPVSIQVSGPDLERLRAHADLLAGQLRDIEGAINVSHDLRPGAPRLDLQTDAFKVRGLGLDPAFVAQEVRMAVSGVTATTMRVGDEDLDVVVRVASEGEESLADLERVLLPVPGGAPVPLAQLTRPELTSTYSRIMHIDLERSVIIGADVDGRLATEVVADLIPMVESLDLSARETWKVIGEDEERDKAFMSMLRNVITALGLIYGILVLQFRSFKQPLVIFTSIPVALAGSVLGLLVGGWPFGFTAFIGLLALVGIVVNDAIVLVDRINQYRYEGEGLEAAIRHAAQSRLQPILLTTLTTQAGLLPLTLFGGSMWGPMGWVIIGGLAAATLVTLVLVPALYLVLERKGERKRIAALRPVTALLALLLIAPVANAAELTLDEVLLRVQEANPQLEMALAEFEMAASQADAARSSRWPRLSLSADLLRTDDPSMTFGVAMRELTSPQDLLGFDAQASVDLLSASATVDWVLWDFTRESLIDAADASAAAQELAARAVAERLRLAAVASYFDVVQLRDQLEVVDATLKLVERELNDAELRWKAGRTVESDVLGLRARRAQVLARQASVEGALLGARAQLAEMMDVDFDTLGEPEADPRIDDLGGVELDQLRRAARTQRAEVQAAEMGITGGASQATAASRTRLPQFVAQAKWQDLVPESDFDREDQSTQIGVGLRWTLFRGNGMRAESRESRANLRRLEASARATRLEVERQVIESWAQRESAAAQLDATELQLESAEEAYRIVSLRYREGRSTLARLLNAEQSLTDARAQRVNALASLQVARAQLRWASGSI